MADQFFVQLLVLDTLFRLEVIHLERIKKEKEERLLLALHLFSFSSSLSSPLLPPPPGMIGIGVDHLPILRITLPRASMCDGGSTGD